MSSASFPARVFEVVRQVPPGRVITYGLIARLLGEPRKARQVGWAMAAGPSDGLPLAAHRVINARGELSGGPAFGGYHVQRQRLEAEGVVFEADGRVDLERYLWLPGDDGPQPEPSLETTRPLRRGAKRPETGPRQVLGALRRESQHSDR
jgi:methylated-DNA-protein-cysteine methyltransferase-like protein